MTNQIVSFRGTACEITAEAEGVYQLRAIAGYPFTQLPYVVSRGRTNEATVAAGEVTPIDKTDQVLGIERKIEALEEQRGKLSFQCDATEAGSEAQADAVLEWIDKGSEICALRDELVLAYEWALTNEAHQADDARDQELTASEVRS